MQSECNSVVKTNLITDNNYIYSFITYNKNFVLFSGSTEFDFYPNKQNNNATLIATYDFDGNLIDMKNFDSGNIIINSALVDNDYIYIV